MKNFKLFTLLFFTVSIYAQDIEWEKSYGGNQAEYLFDAIANTDFEFLNSENSISRISLNKSDINYGALDLGIRTLVDEEVVDYDKKLNNGEGLSHKVDPASISGCSIWKNQTTNKFVPDKKETNLINLLNFNQGISFSREEQLIISKNELKSSFTLFIVFKSNEQQEKDILNYKVGIERLKITNKQTLSTNGLKYSTYNARNGVILEYSANLNGVKNSNICSLFFANKSHNDNDNSDIQEQKTAVFEFIFYPRLLTETEKLKIESYLSIKYGVSLIGDKNYLNSTGTKIWNFNENKSFNSHVTGIGRDENADLFQKQSENSSQNDIHIGFGSLDSISKYTKENVANETFLVWGDNNGNTLFKKSEVDQESPVSKMNRIWKIQKTQKISKDEFSSFLHVNKNFFSTNKKTDSKEATTNIWLAVSSNFSDVFDYENATYYPAEIKQDGEMIFSNIVWDKDKNGSDSFTFIKAPELFMTHELIERNCNLSQYNRLKIKVIGGVLPFVLNIQHNGVVTTLEKNAREFEIEIPTSGKYDLTLVDSKKQSFSQLIKTDSLSFFEGLLAPEWFLNEDSEVEIVPNINSKNAKAAYSYQWKQAEEIISNERTLKLNQQGNYSLKVKNDKGCEKTLPFKVLKKTYNDVTVYPNPVEANEDFKIKFNLEKPSTVEIKIYTINGVLLKHDKIENISTSQYSYKLKTSGNYLIVISTDNQSITNKLIVK